ncbi:MAG: type II secretion system protein GspG [Polyangiaceae bacterium]|nr:type II secretion system protein GspG [Polyangiaceae bacterium]
MLAITIVEPGHAAMDPCVRAGSMLQLIASAVDSNVAEGRGYPDSIDYIREVLFGDHSALLDPWGTEYQYRRIPGGYELFSRGPDGLSCTDDDIFPEGPMPVCERSRWEVNGPCVQAIDRMNVLIHDVRRTARMIKSLEISLEAVHTVLNGGTGGTDSGLLADPWGQRYSYTWCCPAWIRSAGEDGVWDTGDDIHFEMGYAQCGMAPYGEIGMEIGEGGR